MLNQNAADSGIPCRFTLSAKRSSEQSRPNVLKRRQAWFDGQLDLDLERLIFVDETWTNTKMGRTHGRCRKGERLRMPCRSAIGRRPR